MSGEAINAQTAAVSPIVISDFIVKPNISAGVLVRIEKVEC